MDDDDNDEGGGGGDDDDGVNVMICGRVSWSQKR